jgi:hypothetical protein
MTKNLLDRPLPSPLRPHVLAGDCFLTWMTPYGLNSMDEQLETFSPGIIARRRIIMSRAVLPKTLGNYTARLIQFTKFCDDLNISEQNRMPASELLLATFVTTCGAGSVAKGAMEQWILGLELWHHINNAPWRGGRLLKCAVQGSAAIAPSSSTEAKRDPVTLQHLQCLCDHLDLSTSFDAAVFAVACIAFFRAAAGQPLFLRPLLAYRSTLT